MCLSIGAPLAFRLSIAVTLLAITLAFSVRGDSPRSVPVGLILVDSPEEAQRILGLLKAGEDFSNLARNRSTDPSAKDGGYLGDLDPASLRLDLRDALHGLTPGQVSRVVKIPSGYAILKLLKDRQSPPVANPDSSRLLPTAAPVSVRTTSDSSGYPEFLETMRTRIASGPDGANWGSDLKRTCATRKEAPQQGVAALTELIAKEGGKMDPAKLLYTRYTLALLLSAQGAQDKAIEQQEAAYRIALTLSNSKIVPKFEELLGVAYLHRAVQTDAPSHTAVDRSFLFPSHPGPIQSDTRDATKAVEFLTKSLKRDPDNTELRWLLNFASMISGGYPGQVPKEFLMPPSMFASKENLGTFLDVSPAAGVSIYGNSGGVIADDFDNDGLLDIVTSQIDDCAPLTYFHNNGDGTFTDRAAKAGLAGQTGGLNIIQADYNNDGCVDILVLRGGWELPRRRSLLRNNCDGTFTDVTSESGLLEPIRSSQSAVWLDIDNDGKLDLFIANENSPSQLFLNNGDGTFTDISHEAGIDRAAFSKGVVSADYDNDGFADLYVSNFNGENFLYHNNGDRTFTEVGAKAGVTMPRMSFAAWFFDYDNDGWPDLFVTCYYPSVEEVARSYAGLPRNGETLKLYKNMRDGTFRDVTADTGLERVLMPMGSNFGDIDNDGYLDIYLGSGNPSYSSLLPNVLLHNQAGKRFVDITTSSGTGALAKGHGVAFADFNNTGDEDIFIVMGGPEPGDRYRSRLFRNPGGHGNDWITLRLVGVKSNRSAIGARIAIKVENQGSGERTIYRTVGSGGSFGASPLQQHIGLGKSARIEAIEIRWPASKTTQTFENVSPNQFLEIKEFEKKVTKLIRPKVSMGGSSR